MTVVVGDLALDTITIDQTSAITCSYRISVNGAMVTRGWSTAAWSPATLAALTTLVSRVLTDVNAAYKAATIADQSAVKTGHASSLATVAADLATLKALGAGVIGVIT